MQGFISICLMNKEKMRAQKAQFFKYMTLFLSVNTINIIMKIAKSELCKLK